MSKQSEEPNDLFSPEETARRRDEVVRRMAITSPQPRKPKNSPRRGKKTPTVDRKKDRDRGIS